MALITVKRTWGIFLLFFVVLFFEKCAFAENIKPDDIISEIIITGAQRIEPETIDSYLLMQKGEKYSSSKVNESLKALFNTGLFADVNFKRDENSLIVSVVENPVLNRIAFEGNQFLSNKTLDQEITLRPRVIYTRTRVQDDVQTILTLYRRAGHFSATVEPKIIQLPHNRIDLAFEITEGKPTLIENIRFVGNSQITDSKLRTIIHSRQDSWCWAERSGYDPDVLSYDKELLRRHYLKNGFADVNIISSVAELSPDRQSFFITYTIDEGHRYKIDKVEARGFPAHMVEDALNSISKEVWYNPDKVDETIDKLYEELYSLGVVNLRVSPKIERSTVDHLISIVFDFTETSRVFIERININGNLRTLDKVIRREFMLVEGDLYLPYKLRKIKKNIEKLDLFSNVWVSLEPGSAPDQTIINVKIEEKSSGSLSVGGGFSTTSGILAEMVIEEKNLLGKGIEMITKATWERGGLSAEISYSDPYPEYLGYRKIRAKWGVNIGINSGIDWLTVLAGFQITFWVGILTINMPIVLLVLLRGAYFSYLWADDNTRCLKNYRQTISLVTALVTVQCAFFIFSQVTGYLTEKNMENIELIADYVCT